ncbi:DinB family protein [Thalassotalea euphylliae]|uniref:Damage-inducible protein DinB n=1 Tax=Thalassotalea euphylliae TaxID=1655234 RepID=A0A3E0U097_9GAMM|nr:DinB family protein [Thalassotalea euphylliae]REL30338.1 damage-inducible protein DinB [Thalassotalea euphylliae]
MSIVQNFQMMALYNQRINQQLLAVCQALPKALLDKPTDSFFATITSYWNHLLFGDLILLGRLASNNLASLSSDSLASFPTPVSPKDTYFKHIEELSSVRAKLDELLIEFCQGLSEQECGKVIHYTTTEGDTVTKVASDVIQHLFNHQTHHRGQLTCVLSQFGADYGCMDLPVIVPEGSGLIDT